MPTLLQLKSLVAVVDEGGFTAASYRLGMSQPAVSRAVATLEKELGSPLLVRGGRGVVLTDAGSAALPHAREALRHLTLLRTEVAALAGQVAAEAGVVSLPVKGLDSAVLGDQDMVAVLPAEHRLAARIDVGYTDLAEAPFILSTGGCAEVFMPMARRVGVEFDVAFEAREMSAVLAMVRGGLGVSILPSAGLPPLPDGVVVRPLIPKTVRGLGVAVSASASAPARAFLEQIAALER
jgi:DNA-binding transcriptional LysR family regulator